MRISDWSSDVCSSDLLLEQADESRAQPGGLLRRQRLDRAAQPLHVLLDRRQVDDGAARQALARLAQAGGEGVHVGFEAGGLAHGLWSPHSASCRSAAALCCVSCCVRSEEHTSELQSLMRISYAVFC